MAKPTTDLENVATAATPRAATRSEGESDASAGRRHDARETVDTIVFVVVLVLLLKMFGAEAFAIPTGSMATTLYGAHKVAKCPQCGYVSTINASEQVEHGIVVRKGYCQNCRFPLDVSGVRVSSGDRVLVGKFIYEGFAEPKRWDVIVFRCPDLNKADENFIKRAIGEPGETIRIRYGDIFTLDRKAPVPREFKIARKPPDVALEVRRLVFDNDLQPKDLVASGFPRRWVPAQPDLWTISDDHKNFSVKPAAPTWLIYRHIVGGGPRLGNDVPQLVTDFEAYNSSTYDHDGHDNWVGDLMIDCRVDVRQLAGAVTFELVEAGRVYHLVLDLENRQALLRQNGQTLATAPAPIAQVGGYDVCFANFDDRLTAWINGESVFGDGVDVEELTEAEQGPLVADLTPARIGAENADVAVSRLKLFRDIYYTQTAQHSDYVTARYPVATTSTDYLDQWRRELQRNKGADFTVGADQYFMLGDNSPASSDGREWTKSHFVDRKLVVGRALVLYWPPANWKLVE
jgi:signal peptidase I